MDRGKPATGAATHFPEKVTEAVPFHLRRDALIAAKTPATLLLIVGIVSSVLFMLSVVGWGVMALLGARDKHLPATEEAVVFGLLSLVAVVVNAFVAYAGLQMILLVQHGQAAAQV